MTQQKRQHTLDIWAFAFGYFLFYIPYSALAKATTLEPSSHGYGISVFRLLPSIAITTALATLGFITFRGWWRYVRHRRILGFHLPWIDRMPLVSGLGFSVIILTTTIAFSFTGVSILFALILMRAGVLVMAPVIDLIFSRKVRWFSWAALLLSLLSILIAVAGLQQYELNLGALANLVCYLAGYGARLPSMTRVAKTRERLPAYRFFVEEQMVAMSALVLIPAIWGFYGNGAMAKELHVGFMLVLHGTLDWTGPAIGFCYAALGVCCSFIYLDRRENTFCLPMHAGSSLLSGIAASYILAWKLQIAPPTNAQLWGAGVIILALLVMSPLHHAAEYLGSYKQARASRRAAFAGSPLLLDSEVPAKTQTGCIS